MNNTAAKRDKNGKPIINKYYTAATHISDSIAMGSNSDWTRETEKEAIMKAQEILEKEPHQKCVAIVKIIKIVRRKKPEIVIENVK